MLLVVTLLGVTLITLDARGVVALTSAREGAIDLSAPVRGAARWVTTPVRNAWNGISGYDQLREENEDLRSRVDDLEGRDLRNEDAARELARLEEQLGIDSGDFDTQIARVTTGPSSNFTDHTLQLDRGRNSALAVGMPVVTNKGLVGRIVEVSTRRAVVQLITDPDFWIGIRMSSSGVIGKGHGGGDSSTFIGEVSIDTVEPVEPNELVMTGGIERSIMPPGLQIPIGLVDKVTPDEATRIQILQVGYAVDFSEVDVVQVIKWTPPS